MLTNLKHLAIYSFVLNAGTLIYLSIAYTEKNGNYVTQKRENLINPYFDVMLGINSTFCALLLIYIIYSFSKERGSDNGVNPNLKVNKENKLWSIPFFLVGAGYLIVSIVLEQELKGTYNGSTIKNEISSKEIVNNILLVYIVGGSLQLLLCIGYIIFAKNNETSSLKNSNRVNPLHHINYLLADSHPEEIALLSIVVITIIGTLVYIALVITNRIGVGNIWPGIPYKRPCPNGTTDSIPRSEN